MAEYTTVKENKVDATNHFLGYMLLCSYFIPKW